MVKHFSVHPRRFVDMFLKIITTQNPPHERNQFPWNTRNLRYGFNLISANFESVEGQNLYTIEFSLYSRPMRCSFVLSNDDKTKSILETHRQDMTLKSFFSNERKSRLLGAVLLAAILEIQRKMPQVDSDDE